MPTAGEASRRIHARLRDFSYNDRMRVSLFLLCTFFAVAGHAQAQLRQQIRAIAKDAHGQVSVACSVPGSALNCDLQPRAHPPQQSVFKLPLAIAVLAHATNDIGLIPLADGRRIAIAVFVTDATADQSTREKVIARIGRAVYDASLRAH
jgi:hypothetical protein